MIDLISEARQFQLLCEQRDWRFCFIGGLAVQQWGEPRLTRDVDVSLMTGFGDEERFISSILVDYEPRISDAAEFAKRHRVLLIRGKSGIDLDISLAALPFEEEMINRSVDVEYLEGVSLRICSAADLIVLKCFADRSQDWHDVRSVLIRQGTQSLPWTLIDEQLGPLVRLKGAPQILDRLAALRSEIP